MPETGSTKNKVGAAHPLDRFRRDTTGVVRADGKFPRLVDSERPPRAPAEMRAGFRSPIAPVRRPAKMRVLFVTGDDPLYVVQFFEVFFQIYPRSEIDICGITIDRAFHEPLRKTLSRMLRFYGTWGTFRQGLRFLS